MTVRSVRWRQRSRIGSAGETLLSRERQALCELLRTPCLRTSQNFPSETVWKFRRGPKQELRGRREGAKGAIYVPLPLHRLTIQTPQAIFQTVSQLDFSHFQKGRVGYAGHRSVERGEPYAYPTEHDDTGFGPLCAIFLRARLRACPAAYGGCDPHSGKTHCQLGLASDGSGSAQDLPSLPPGVEPGEVV